MFPEDALTILKEVRDARRPTGSHTRPTGEAVSTGAGTPLNQAARQWLGKINKLDKKQTINENYQYVFQLMWWGLDEANLQFPNKRQTEIFEEILLEMLGADNQQGEFRYLQGPPEEPRIDEYDLQSASDPEEAALKLIEALDMALSSDENLYKIYPPINPMAHLLPSWNKI